MYWLVIVLSIAGMPDLTIETKMGSKLHCSLAQQKFEEGNPPTVFVQNEKIPANLTFIKCLKKEN
jgi:hypothetical protein